MTERLAEKVKVTDETCFAGWDAHKKVLACDLDMVILTEPPYFRPGHLRAAIEAGKHVFMEKPVAVDPVGVRSVIESARGLLVDSLEPNAALTAAVTARAAGIPVVVDAGTLREGVVELLPFCDYIVGSELFACQISGGKEPLKALDDIMSFGPKAAVITLGERGCVFLSGSERFSVDGFEVGAVDTTGAGDVFHGAFLFGVLQGWDIYRICVFANATAAMKCRMPGGRRGIPDRVEVHAFLSGRSPEMDFPGFG